MQSLSVLIGVALLVGCGFAQPSSAPQSSELSKNHKVNFKSETGGFAVWLPAKLEQNDETRAGTVSARPEIFTPSSRAATGTYWMVQYCQLSEVEMKKLSVNAILDQARHDALAEAFGTLKKETEITVNGYAGRHIVADSALKRGGIQKPDGTYEARVFLVGNRVYRVATYVFNANWGGNLEKMDEFLRSFILLRP
jgi:hypothetical protein